MQECKKRNVAAVATGEKLCRVNPVTVKVILRIASNSFVDVIVSLCRGL